MYFEKYKKYKKKYLQLQRGGVIENNLSDSELVVLSWNILNSDVEINKFTFSFYTNKFAEQISRVDNTRFFNFRKYSNTKCFAYQHALIFKNQHAIKQQKLEQELQSIVSEPEGLVALLQLPNHTGNTEQTIHDLTNILKGLNT